MVSLDESALICDFAETYHILDWRALPLSLAAVLAVGLRETSRIKMKMSNSLIEQDTALLAAAVDRLTWLAWAQTKDGSKGLNRPKSVLSALLKSDTGREKYKGFDTAEEFEAARARILRKGG